MSTPNIDTLGREIDEAIDLLRFAKANLADLHSLGYTPRSSGLSERTAGGDRDYALDEVGDLTARDLLSSTSKAVYDLVNGSRTHDGLRHHLEAIRSHLTRGTGGVRTDKTADATADEVIEALDARRRRDARGEYEPALLAPQPLVVSQTDWRKECEALRAAVRKAVLPFVDEHQTCQATATDHRGQRVKLKRRVQPKLLTPREREAWLRATQSVSAEPESAAS